MRREPYFTGDSKSYGFHMASHHPDARELRRKHPKAYMLANEIAERAKYTPGFSADGLEPGEAMLGDYQSYGMTEKEYRGAKHILEKYGFGAFKTTTRGTIARLTDKRLFYTLGVSSNSEKGGQGADDQRGQPTANPEFKTDKRADAKQQKKPKEMGLYERMMAGKGGQDGGREADEGRTNHEKRATNLPLPVSVSPKGDGVTEGSLSPQSDFYVPTEKEVWDYANAQGLDLNAVEKFLNDRARDRWLIKGKDGKFEPVRKWQPFLHGFVKTYLNSRAGKSH